MTAVVRTATRFDADAIRGLTRGFGGRRPLPDDDYYARRFEQVVADSAWLLLLAEDNELPIGYALAQNYGPPGLRAAFTVGRLHDLYVDPDHRRKGAARAMMAAVAEWARSRPDPMVLDWQASATGFAFYQALGFAPDYVGDNLEYPAFCLDFRESPSQP